MNSAAMPERRQRIMSSSKWKPALSRIAILLSLLMAFGSVQSATPASGADASSQSIRIASFNIEVFGKTKAGNADVMCVLVDIVRKYDIVAVQEIKDINGKVPGLFLDDINESGDSYDVLVSERTGREKDDESSQEQYAYYYRTSAIAVLDKGILYDDSQSDHFQREPFVARFESRSGNFTFAMINIHTRPQRAVEEIGALGKVVEWARQRYAGEDDYIVLGDFNAGCGYASEEELQGLEISGLDYAWLVPHSADTNLAESRCAYDRIVISKEGTEDYAGVWDVDRAFTDKRISNHWPVWAEFHVDRDSGR